MRQIERILEYLCGEFDNDQQLEQMGAYAEQFPFCRHKNTLCNDKIKNLPANFSGYFVLEESDYYLGDNANILPHLFLFTEDQSGNVVLTSYNQPGRYSHEDFRYTDALQLDFKELTPSPRFSPITYHWDGTAFAGESVSQFSPILRFTLKERIGPDILEVQEIFERDGQCTFGYDQPILYRRRN